MRPEITDRMYKVYTYQDVDRVPDIEFGYWPQTIRRWLKEGLPADMESEKSKMFSAKLDAFFGFDEGNQALVTIRMGMHPPFEEKIIERRGNAVLMRDTTGIIALRYTSDVDESSIPHFVEFPVKTPADWAEVRERLRPDDPWRGPDEPSLAAARRKLPTAMVVLRLAGFYGHLRNLMGMENLSLAFFEYPDMVHDMADLWAENIARQVEALPPDLPIDFVTWWEDMASKNGPLVSPRTFREFLQPGYHRVMTAVRKHGCVASHVDCDGNPHDIVANWLEEGVNVMFPLEVTAGVDAYAWRREFGRDLRLRGGVAKAPLVQGGKAIDRELERIKPLLDQGGYIPHLDHLVPPDIPYKHYRQYLDKKRKLIGK